MRVMRSRPILPAGHRHQRARNRPFNVWERGWYNCTPLLVPGGGGGGRGLTRGTSERLTKQFDRDASLLDQRTQGPRLDGTVHRDYNGTVRTAHDDVRASLPAMFKAKAAQRTNGLRAVDVPRDLHATANTGSCTKWKRIVAGVLPSSKYPPTASVTIS